jgi:hypothetical protein
VDGRVVPIGIDVPILDCFADRGGGREFRLVIGVPRLPRRRRPRRGDRVA